MISLSTLHLLLPSAVFRTLKANPVLTLMSLTSLVAEEIRKNERRNLDFSSYWFGSLSQFVVILSLLFVENNIQE